jgi:hypothetical protein
MHAPRRDVAFECRCAMYVPRNWKVKHYAMKTYGGSASRPCRFTPRKEPPSTHFIGGWVDPRAGLDYMEKWKFFTLPRLELLLPLVVQPVASCYTDWAISAAWKTQEKMKRLRTPWALMEEVLRPNPCLWRTVHRYVLFIWFLWML